MWGGLVMKYLRGKAGAVCLMWSVRVPHAHTAQSVVEAQGFLVWARRVRVYCRQFSL